MSFKIPVLHHTSWIYEVFYKASFKEMSIFEYRKREAGSSMSRQMCPGVLSLDSRGYMAFKEDKDWLCYKRTSHFLERKMH